MDLNFLSTFKNGGSNYSFGRVMSGIVVFVGLTIIAGSVWGDYRHPTKPVIMSRYELKSKTSFQETILVAEPNWNGYQTFLLGIATLAGAIYGVGKISDTVGKFSNNPSTEGFNSAVDTDPDPDPKPPRG